MRKKTRKRKRAPYRTGMGSAEKRRRIDALVESVYRDVPFKRVFDVRVHGA